MLKSVLYYLLLLTTSVRILDLLYLLTRDSTNLPIPVILAVTAMILFGVVLLVKRFVSPVRLKHLTVFYIAQTVVILFNITYVSITCPLQISVSETVAMGTFLDVIVNCGIIYLCMKHMRSRFMPFLKPVERGIHV